MIILGCQFSSPICRSFVMDNADNNGRKRDIRERIVRAIQATEQAPNQQIPAEDLLRLKKAATRLDEILKDTAEAEVQGLKNAAARLGHLLEDLRTGKDVVRTRRRD
jgi:hypothetical protein